MLDDFLLTQQCDQLLHRSEIFFATLKPYL